MRPTIAALEKILKTEDDRLIDIMPDGSIRTRASDFRKELSSCINRHSRENGSNTPDFILAEYLEDCLAAFDRATKARKRWYAADRDPVEKRDAET